MTRQILYGLAQLKIFPDTRMAQVEAGIAKAVVEGVIRIAIFPLRDCSRDFAQSFRIEAEDFANFARCHATAVSDDVSSHGGAAFAIAAVQILDDGFAIVAAGEIEINVRQLAAFFGEKSLEQQVHADGIYGRDTE